MSDVSSSKAVINSDVKIEQKSGNTNTADKVAFKKDASSVSDPVKPAGSDVFMLSEKAGTQKKQWYRDFINKTSDLSNAAKKNAPKTSPGTAQKTPVLLAAMHSRMINPFTKVQQQVYRQKQEITDIYDKLAAIYGEKEKDLKDKLSDTFKKLVPKEYNSLEAVNTSMDQKEHKKEKKLKDRGTGQQQEKIKEFTLLKKINYKLLEIKGEILSLTGNIPNIFKKRNKSLKNRLHPKYRDIKGKIVGTLDVIDEMFEEEEEHNENRR